MENRDLFYDLANGDPVARIAALLGRERAADAATVSIGAALLEDLPLDLTVDDARRTQVLAIEAARATKDRNQKLWYTGIAAAMQGYCARHGVIPERVNKMDMIEV